MDRNDVFASATVQHVDAALLGRSQQCRFHAIGCFHVHQGRLTTNVHVPQVMVSELTGPANFTGIDVQCSYACAVLLGVLCTVAAVLVRHLVAHRQVKHAEVFVHCEHRPHVRRVASVGFAFSNRRSVVRIAAVPVPYQFAGTYVVRADHAGWLVGGQVVGYVTTNHNQVFGHGRWRGGVVATRSELTDVVAQVNLAMVTEVFTHFTGVGIDGDQTGVGSRHEQAARARVAGSSGRRLGRALFSADFGVGRFVVIAHATASHVRPTLEVGFVHGADLRIEAPDFLAGIRVKGNHLAVWGTHVHHAVDFQRGVLGSCFARIASARNVTGAVCPGWNQLVDILRGDFFKRRVAVAMGSTPVGLPVTIRHGRSSVGHARYGITVQLAFDFARVGELASQCGRTGQHHGNAQRAGNNRSWLAAQQWTTQPWQQQHDADGKPQGQTWH